VRGGDCDDRLEDDSDLHASSSSNTKDLEMGEIEEEEEEGEITAHNEKEVKFSPHSVPTL
jgi:hypothetical protein